MSSISLDVNMDFHSLYPSNKKGKELDIHDSRLRMI